MGALDVAARNGQKRIIKILLDAKASRNVGPPETQGLSIVGAVEAGDIDMVKFLLEHGSNVYEAGYADASPVTIAASARDMDMLKYLIEVGCDVNEDIYPDRQGPPLTEAAQYGDDEMIKILLAAGARVDASDPEDNTALKIAAKYQHPSSARLLIDAGANVNEPGGDPGPPLATAVYCGDVAIVRMLLDAGADVNLNSEIGTPLRLAAKARSNEIADLLRSRDADMGPGPLDPETDVDDYELSITGGGASLR